MRRLVEESARYPEVKRVAVLATQGCGPVAFGCFVRKIYDFVKARMRYVPDTHEVEEITAPWVHARRFLSEGASYGDCDDFSVVEAALLKSVGVPVRLTVIASPKHGGFYDHVRAEANVAGQWIPLETTSAKLQFGQSIPDLRRFDTEV